MRDTFLPFSPPLLGDEEIAEVVDTLRSDWITTGPKVGRFEERFAAYVGAPAALALNSGTAALHVGLAALGIGPGDAVVTSPMTFCSSVHVIEHVGATPILVDVKPDTLNINPDAVEAALHSSSGHAGPTVKAILPVHLYGHPCDMDRILDIAREHELVVLDDAAHALPAKHNGRNIGTLGTLTAFSFYATKNLTTAEGGMLTGSPQLLQEARIWSLHGMSRDIWQRHSATVSWQYEVTRCGFKYNMTDIQAAIGLQQLPKLPDFQARRQAIVRMYNEAFSRYAELRTPTEAPEVEHAWHLYVLRLDIDSLDLSRNQFAEELAARNIGCSVHFIPVHLHPYYRERYGYRPEDFPVAYREFQRIISLPLYPKMRDEDVEDVIETVGDLVRRFRK